MSNDVLGPFGPANPVPHDKPLHLPGPLIALPSSRLVFGVATAVAALAGASIAIAAGFGAFNGSARQNIRRPPPTSSTRPPQPWSRRTHSWRLTARDS